jgi:CarD family transcriptional regulator, regulator of rRNA transcription
VLVRGPPPRHPDDKREELPAVEGIIADAGELEPGDRVVYPNQGVCVVVGVEEKDIAGQKLVLVRMRREEDGAAVMVPKNKVPSVGLRRVASGEQMEGVFHYLAAQFDDPELDWKVRHRDNADRLIAGGVLGVAEVVKGLHSLSRLRPLPTKEREQYDNARHLLVHEVAVSLGVPPGLAEDYVDFALMPPAGVKFDLKPPPKPVLLPSRPKKRRPVAEEGEGDDLGLGDLGIDLREIDAALEGVGAPGVEGADAGDGDVEGEKADEKAEGEGEEAAAPALAGDDDEDAPPPPRAAAKAPERKAAAVRPQAAPAEGAAKAPARKAERPAPAKASKAAKRKPEKPAREAKHEKPAPARKAAPKKAAAARKAAPKPAAKRGGKK